MNVKEIRWLVVAAGCAIPPVAHAYVDPGSAGLLVTSVLAAIAAAGYRLRRHWERVRRWFLKEPPAPAGGKGRAPPRRIPPIRHTRALVRDLARLVEGLEAPAAGPWARYPRQHAYGERDVKAKEAFVERHLRAVEAGTVWDLGANTGRYSVLASAHCERVVAIESDPGAAERACRALEEACPERGWVVVADVTDLHPAPGFAGGEREALEARAPPDCVLCLALLHHLRVTAGIALDAIVRWLGSLRARIILEWIDRTDGAFEALCARHGEAYPDYTREHLEREIERYFQVVERQPLMEGKRTLLALRPREEGGGATTR